MKKSSKIIGNIIYFGAIAVLLILFVLFVLEKSRVTNLYTKPEPLNQQSVTWQPNDIQYTAANPTDNDTTNQQKEDGTLDQTPPTPATGSPINVVLTAAGQDESGGPIVVKVLLTDVTSGTCDVVMQKKELIKNYTAPVINVGTYYTCDGFEIPIDDLENGEWKLTTTVTSTDRVGSATQNIQVGS